MYLKVVSLYRCNHIPVLLKAYDIEGFNVCTLSDIERVWFKLTDIQTGQTDRQTDMRADMKKANKLQQVMAGWDWCAERDEKSCQEKPHSYHAVAVTDWVPESDWKKYIKKEGLRGGVDWKCE